MCEHDGQPTLIEHTISDTNTHFEVSAICPDCGITLWVGIKTQETGEIRYTDVSPIWHGKMMRQATEQIQELMAIVADNARKRAEMETEYREMTNRAIRDQKAAEQTAVNRLNLLTSIQSRIVEIATDLAHAGSYDHKGKNESILRVLARLLTISQWRTDSIETPRTNNDDLPF